MKFRPPPFILYYIHQAQSRHDDKIPLDKHNTIVYTRYIRKLAEYKV